MKKFRIMLIVALALVLSFALIGCGEKKEEAPAEPAATEEAAPAEEPAEEPAPAEEAAPAPDEEDAAGFEEFPLGEEFDLEPYIHVAGVYFQPVDMYPENLGLTKDKSNMHIEADISCLEGNDLGFGAGDWLPFATVDYVITQKDSGELVQEGTFMPMSASDGPHYGANLLLEEAGSYVVKFLIHSPEKNGYVLHVDETTGVPRHEFWQEPLEVQWDFDYVPNPEW